MTVEKEYYTIDEVAQNLGRNRATVYNRMGLLGLTGHKFKRDRKTYLSAQEVEQVKEVFEKPWLVGEDIKGGDAA